MYKLIRIIVDIRDNMNENFPIADFSGIISIFFTSTGCLVSSGIFVKKEVVYEKSNCFSC